MSRPLLVVRILICLVSYGATGLVVAGMVFHVGPFALAQWP